METWVLIPTLILNSWVNLETLLALKPQLPCQQNGSNNSISLKELLVHIKYDHVMKFILSTVSWAFVMHLALCISSPLFILWRVVQILCHPPGGTLNKRNSLHADF